jgi:hypothetical protein
VLVALIPDYSSKKFVAGTTISRLAKSSDHHDLQITSLLIWKHSSMSHLQIRGRAHAPQMHKKHFILPEFQPLPCISVYVTLRIEVYPMIDVGTSHQNSSELNIALGNVAVHVTTTHQIPTILRILLF